MSLTDHVKLERFFSRSPRRGPSQFDVSPGRGHTYLLAIEWLSLTPENVIYEGHLPRQCRTRPFRTFFFHYLISFRDYDSFRFCSRKPPSEWPNQCTGANSRKLDKQTVLLKKVIRLLTNLRILDSLRCIESRKLD